MTLDWDKIQDKWQKKWAKAEIGKSTVQKKKEKFSIIFAYPGPSGFLHVGHMRGYSYTDMIARYQRLLGKEVFFPVGMHASGLPAIGFAAKVARKDKDMIEYLKRNGCNPSTIKKLADPHFVVSYFSDMYINNYWKKFGFLCDWDRFTCTTQPDYEKFIQWQFRTLHKKGLLVQQPYFATACIKCGPVAVDPSETDISKGGNAEKNEYTLLKFKFKDAFIIAATLRPETIYGQTNLWVNPKTTYVRVNVNKEFWIMSKEAAQKLQYQKDDVTILEDVSVNDLIGNKATAPGIQKDIIILPATFCDPNIGSGIVTSVPSDAPFDYVALQTLKKDKALLKKFNISTKVIEKINPIPIIVSKGYGVFPAEEIVQKEKITSLTDPQLDVATKEIYKVGYHTGVMHENCQEFAGTKVTEAKELMKAKLIEQNDADIFYDLSEEVLCRCGGQVVIKRIDDQWFIRYSDQELTERSKEQVQEMDIHPKEYKDHLPATLDWFAERACTRLGNWFGSKFPFDDKWIVEPISDSTLYPAYYIVSKYVNNKTIKTEELTDEFFNYVFLGKGKKQKEWEQIREEFNYFYPLDLNIGGKEHQTVHFPVFLMNHVAILPENKWPKGIFVHWWVTGKGSKISKSKGGAQPIPQAIAKYGVDAMRLYYAHIGSSHVDVVWDEDVVHNYKNALERIYALISQSKAKKSKKQGVDNWLTSRLNEHIQYVTKSLDQYNLRDAASSVYYTMYDDLRWYLRRGGSNTKVLREYTSTWSQLMNPITPHFSEEIWNQKTL